MIWFTADWHLWHENMLHLCGRPFKNCRSLHKRLVYNHNSVIKLEDTLYIVGDVYWKKSVDELSRILERVKGHKVLILGNHDKLKPFDYIEAGFDQVATSLEVKGFLVAHDPSLSILNPKVPLICGHVHDLFKRQKNVLNVGVDVWDFKPVSIEQARKEFENGC